MTFTTVVDNQSVVEIHVLQGERELAAANRSLAKFEMVDIPAAPRGVPQIDVTFDIDASGILSVSAKDQSTGREQEVNVTPSSGLSSDEIKHIIDDARFRAEEDRRQKEERILKNRMGGLLQSTGKTFNEFGWLLPDGDQAFVRDALRAAKEAEDGVDSNVNYGRLLQDLEQSASFLTHAMFSSQGSKDGKASQPTKTDEMLSWLNSQGIDSKS